MNSYITKPLSIKKNEIFGKNKIFSPSRYRKISLKNSNYKPLSTLIEISKKSTNIKNNKGYYQYIEIGDINTATGAIQYKTVKSVDISTDSAYIIQKDDILISTVRTYLGGIGLVTSNDMNLIATKALIVLREMKNNVSKFYLFGILRSKFFIDQVSMILNASMYPRMEKQYFDYLIVPFPTVANNQTPKDIETLVALLTQNIIDKEVQIRNKNIKIDEKIESELKTKQSSKNSQYSYPKLSAFKNEKRLDCSIYGSKYKELESLILNYKNGKYFLTDKSISPGTTPKDYHFSDYQKDDRFYEWITPKNIEKRQIAFKTYIHTKTKTKVKKYSLILNGIRYVGNGIFVDEDQMFYTNQNTLIINQFTDKTKQLFLFCFLTSDIGRNMQTHRRNFGIVPILYVDSLCKIPIPNFPQEKQEEIVKDYYNKVETPKGITLNNYLEVHKKRNRELGIFQLNMEIFSLKKQLERLIDNIVMNEKIDIDEYLKNG